ncbi:PH domain-containing protein [Clostridium sp. CCUG 7971]|uniref:PH domain-containing protein n=1 Tax=Clostridium sp. CCUG 7971 TaxID=2811414 RepID=UPI001ABBC588|nr:PH domain-containing protein [Clostridium sp. CCUG 7971]MBO3445914.1 PH domain-containing protein [Clostridium sp. CCUG 7971]
MDKIINEIVNILDEDEEILLSLRCSIKTVLRTDVYRPGILTSTNKRLIFYAYNLGDTNLIEVINYEDISSIEKKKVLLKEYITIRGNFENIVFSNILSDNSDEFIDFINKILD